MERIYSPKQRGLQAYFVVRESCFVVRIGYVVFVPNYGKDVIRSYNFLDISIKIGDTAAMEKW